MRTGPPGAREEVTILLVEDDPTLQSTLAFNLTREGYRVLRASDGQEALDAVAEHGPELSLIVLDVMMPKLNGLQVLRRVRAHHDVAVLMLSARGEEQDKIDGLELGADDYVVKPFALREFLARVRAAIRRRAAPAVRPPSVLFRGNLQIEPDRRRALIAGTELDFRPKEFGLLAALAMEPGRVFSRQDLLDLVWGDDIIVDERTVDVHISWLRGKLQAAGLRGARILTVYGAGYRFTHDEAGALDVRVATTSSPATGLVKDGLRPGVGVRGAGVGHAGVGRSGPDCDCGNEREDMHGSFRCSVEPAADGSGDRGNDRGRAGCPCVRTGRPGRLPGAGQPW